MARGGEWILFADSPYRQNTVGNELLALDNWCVNGRAVNDNDNKSLKNKRQRFPEFPFVTVRLFRPKQNMNDLPFRVFRQNLHVRGVLARDRLHCPNAVE